MLNFTWFVTKFCSGGHLVVSQEFRKVVDVYKKTQWTLKLIAKPYKRHIVATLLYMIDLYMIWAKGRHTSPNRRHTKI